MQYPFQGEVPFWENSAVKIFIGERASTSDAGFQPARLGQNAHSADAEKDNNRPVDFATAAYPQLNQRLSGRRLSWLRSHRKTVCGVHNRSLEVDVIPTRKPLLILLLLVVGVTLRARADEHPVPLPKDADNAKCAECHEDKTKGKAVHSAIQMGCTTCHEIKTEGETTHINLVQPKDQLCFTCHDKSKDEVKHGPYDKGQCVTCHDPHTSDYPKQLRAELNAKFCLECHGARKDAPEKVAVFKSQELTRDDFNEIPKIYLSADLTHDHPVDKHPTAGIANPMKPGEKLTCTSCHATHSAAQEKLLPAADKEGRDICTQCHVIVDTAKQDRGLIEGQALEAKRIQELKKQNPEAGKAPKKRRNTDEER